MTESRLGIGQILFVVGVSTLALLPGLSSSGRLTYHEAIWAETAQEMIQSGDILIPRLNGEPWLEKPPLGTWLIAGSSLLLGRVSEWTTRLPSVVSAVLLAVGTGWVGAKWFGPRVGALAGAIQATSLWTVMRGRLGEVDITLACLLTWALIAFDEMRDEEKGSRYGTPWSWFFWILLGVIGLAKGTGFGAVLIASVVVLSVVFEWDSRWFRGLWFPPGWLIAGSLCVGWPLLVLMQYPAAAGLWYIHLADRLATKPVYFAGQPMLQYVLAPFWQTLPWTLLAVVGAWRSLRNAINASGEGDRFLWAWAVGPAIVVSLATVKNAHYLIYALPPWSVWAACSMSRLRLWVDNQGWTWGGIQGATWSAFLTLALVYGSGYLLLGPYFDRRGKEWSFYEVAGRALEPSEPLALLYDPDDHFYPSLSGPAPHDLGVRLFYLAHRASVRVGITAVRQKPVGDPTLPYAVLGRWGDEPSLRELGQVEILVRGPSVRSDRSYALFRISPGFKEQTQKTRASQEKSLR